MNTPASISDVQPGDQVIRDSSEYGGERLTIERVHRVTATQIIISIAREGSEPYVIRFDRADGCERRASDYSYSRRQRLMLPTPELIARAHKRILVERLTGIKWATLDLESLKAVSEALKPKTP